MKLEYLASSHDANTASMECILNGRGRTVSKGSETEWEGRCTVLPNGSGGGCNAYPIMVLPGR